MGPGSGPESDRVGETPIVAFSIHYVGPTFLLPFFFYVFFFFTCDVVIYIYGHGTSRMNGNGTRRRRRS